MNPKKKDEKGKKFGTKICIPKKTWTKKCCIKILSWIKKILNMFGLKKFWIKKCCQNPNPTSTQPNLTYVWVLHENDFAHPPTTTHRQYLIYTLPNFDQILKIGSCNHLEQIPIVTVTFVQTRLVHIRNISDVTDPIFAKVFGRKFGSPNNLDQTKSFLDQKFV